MNWKVWQKKRSSQPKKKKSATREWFDAILFAVIAATIIRGLFIEAYMIPTGSMEKSLLVGDYLFVSKLSYGARTPITPVSFPFAHHTMPIFGTKAYWDGIKLPYYRLPGFGSVKRGDVVVFNYPMDADSPYYRPVDKRENYIKRCQAIAGDTLQIINGLVMVNGQPNERPPYSQTYYYVKTNGTDFNPKMLEELGIEIGQQSSESDYMLLVPNKVLPQLKKFPNVVSVTVNNNVRNAFDAAVFPHDPHYQWNQDYFGPLIVPKKGWTVKLDTTTFPLYRRAIEVYESNKLEVKGNEFYLNGAKADKYTFKMDYYWMMGDNRHNSLDSRFWGFVPEDHIVGKAIFVWMSWNSNTESANKIRWDRIFMGIK